VPVTGDSSRQGSVLCQVEASRRACRRHGDDHRKVSASLIRSVHTQRERRSTRTTSDVALIQPPVVIARGMAAWPRAAARRCHEHPSGLSRPSGASSPPSRRSSPRHQAKDGADGSVITPAHSLVGLGGTVSPGQGRVSECLGGSYPRLS
jgi:hypothetical protein